MKILHEKICLLGKRLYAKSTHWRHASLKLSMLILLHVGVTSVAGYVQIDDRMHNVQVVEGEKAKFVCKVLTHQLDERSVKVHWKHNGLLIYLISHETNFTAQGRIIMKTDRNRHTLIIRNAQLKDTGVYTCVVSLGVDTAMSSAYLLVKGSPSAPRHVAVIRCVGRTAELRWDKGRENGTNIKYFVIQFITSKLPNRWHDYFDHIPGNVLQATIELSPWGTYSFRVRAVRALGISSPSTVSEHSCTTPPERPDSNPKDVRTRTGLKNTLVIEWKAMHRLHRNGDRFGYLVKWRQKGSLEWKSTALGNADQTEFQAKVPDIYGLFELQVIAQNVIGLSRQPAFTFIGRSGEAEPLVSPKDFRLNPNHPTEAHKAYFIWEAVNSSVTFINGKFSGYKLRYWKSVEGRHKNKEIDFVLSPEALQEPDVRVSVSDLCAYTAYRAQVAVMNTHFFGPPSLTIDFFTPEGTPGSVKRLHVAKYGVGYVLLKWLPPDLPNGKLLGYDIAYQYSNAIGKLKGLLPQVNNPSTLGARISGLKSNHQYRFHVSARTRSGRGETSFTDITTLPGELPEQPKLLRAKITNTSINITWKADQVPDTHYLLAYRYQGSGESYSLHGEETNVMNTAVIDIFVEHSCLQIIVLFVAQLVILN